MIAGSAHAHTGIGATAGLAAGLGHPVGGLDHLLAMVAVGILAAQLGGRAVWAVPTAFVSMMAMGAVVAIAGQGMPFVELGIVGSVIILGLVIAAGRRITIAGAMALVGALAVFHGHAHGTEMPVDSSGLVYGLGFVISTALLHAFGIGIAVGAQRFVSSMAPVAVRIGGAAIALVGLGLTVT